MKPLPAQTASGAKTATEPMPSLPSALTAASGSGKYSTANRRASGGAAQRAYPWLLCASTTIAGLFCLLYITKPVIVPSPREVLPSGQQGKPTLAHAATGSPSASLLPGQRLPGDSATTSKPLPADPRQALPAPPSSSAFEETNLRIQHILTAEAPGGHLDRIVLDVPVLYQSRGLRWDASQTAQARDLLARLTDYQERSRQLRAEGAGLLNDWNQLITGSIPAASLRADSPSLPANQQDAADAPRPADLITTESIQIKTPGK